MEEAVPILPTLERLIEYLLDLEAKQQAVRKRWSASLEANRPGPSYLSGQPRTTSEKLREELGQLELLIADCQTVIMEFIPTYFQSIPISVQGQLYCISKGSKAGNKAPFLIVRQKD